MRCIKWENNVNQVLGSGERCLTSARVGILALLAACGGELRRTRKRGVVRPQRQRTVSPVQQGDIICGTRTINEPSVTTTQDHGTETGHGMDIRKGRGRYQNKKTGSKTWYEANNAKNKKENGQRTQIRDQSGERQNQAVWDPTIRISSQ